MSTAFAQQKDSIAFSINESRALVDSWLTLPKVIEVKDSLERKVSILEAENKECENLNGMYKEQNKNYHFYAETMSKEIDKQDVKIEKLTFWNKFWRGATGGVAAVLGGALIYEEIKN